jgi:hypothetical protein
VPTQAEQTLPQAERRIAEAAHATRAQQWAEATAALTAARAQLDDLDAAITAATDRLRELNAVSADPTAEVERTRFAVRDAQRLAMQGRTAPDPRHAGPLDEAVARLDRAVAGLTGRHPDYWHFLTETAAVRATAARVVAAIREQAAGRPY